MTYLACDPVLRALHQAGQSPWLDNIRRRLLTSGELAQLCELGISGVTSNPTIFEKAVEGSRDYDEALASLARDGVGAEEALWRLMVEDIQAAADVLRPVYEAGGGEDGYVSIEVSPKLARDTEGTLAMAKELFGRCARPNVMVKIPGTREGLPAVRQALAAGVNVNVTLIFSVDRYAEVVEAFMGGLEDRLAAGEDVSRLASVASFFVSRVDTKVDRALDQLASRGTNADPRLAALRGRIGIANSKLAYRKWAELHSGPRWERLAAAGARPQRCLWASTSTKDPAYPDTLYAAALIGPSTVDTLPPQTIDAMRDHGVVARTLDAQVEEAEARIQELAGVGVDLDQVTADLESEGVDSFVSSFDSLLATIEAALKREREGSGPTLWLALGRLEGALDERLAKLDAESASHRLWESDPTLWPEAKRPQDWTGWLEVTGWIRERMDQIQAAAADAAAFDDVVVLGMGGSSLAPTVFATAFPRIPGRPRLRVLDSTDPEAVHHLEAELDPSRTLFVVASKSGGTLETLSHFAHFHARVAATVADAGRHFIAITDPGSPLESLARSHGFANVFLNRPDIGGRYSALSFFGLVPAALAGLDVEAQLASAERMAGLCGPGVEAAQNPALVLGAALGEMALRGHDKLTLHITPALASLGDWIEQLIAESTGKLGRGIVPVTGEPLGDPSAYGDDRLFVCLRTRDEPKDAKLAALALAGQPLMTLTVDGPAALGGEFLRWEMATAIAGSILRIDPFDQPNVQESKDNTNQVLAQFEREGRLPEAAASGPDEIEAVLAGLMERTKSNSYFAVMAYLPYSVAVDQMLLSLRTKVRDRRLATTTGYGPRFLHSTGQLHKGGPPVGVFLQLVHRPAGDADIPGQSFGFATLEAAQSLGDLRSLERRGYPVARLDLGDDLEVGLARLASGLQRWS